MNITGRYILIALALAALPFIIPALVGGGFILAALAAVLIVVVLIGGRLGWELKVSREMGSKGRRRDLQDRSRDLIGGSNKRDGKNR